jgi:hypothetical protein
MKMKGSLKQVLTAISLVFPIATHAYSVVIDDFSVDKNGSTIFQDSFSDGSPPPIAPAFNNGNPASYFVRGTMGPETGGKLTIDSSGAEQAVGATGELVNVQLARLLTNVNPATPALGLRANVTFSVSGLFDIYLPDLRQTYGVRLNDGTASNTTPDDIVELVVRQDLSTYWAEFRHVDFVAGSTTLIERVQLSAPLFDQVELTLAKEDAGLDAITASITYWNLGAPVLSNTFTTTHDIFNGEDFTRAEFISRAVIPVPAAVWLFG